MRTTNKIGIAGLVSVGILAFFMFAPVFFWFNVYGPILTFPQPNKPIYSVYRSLGCVVFGFGDILIYGSAYPPPELSLTCEAGPIILQ
jgi:hypothetical protein